MAREGTGRKAPRRRSRVPRNGRGALNRTLKDSAPAAEFYTVQKGDTLWAIAEKHYGKGQGAKYTEIVKANSPPVKNPDLIQPGWVLRIPKP